MTSKVVSASSINNLKTKLMDELSNGFTPVGGAYAISSSFNVIVCDDHEDKRMNSEMIQDVSLEVTNALFASVDRLSSLQSEGFRVRYVCSNNNDMLIMLYKPSQCLLDIEKYHLNKKSGWALIKYEEVEAPE